MIPVRATSTFASRMTRNRLSAALLLALTPLAATAAAPVLPDAGAIFQQLVYEMPFVYTFTAEADIESLGGSEVTRVGAPRAPIG